MNKLLKENTIMTLYIIKLIENLEESIKCIKKNELNFYEYKRYLIEIKRFLEQCLEECDK